VNLILPPRFSDFQAIENLCMPNSKIQKTGAEVASYAETIARF